MKRRYTQLHAGADYDHLLPSLDFDIGLTDTLKARFSYSKTIARAQYDQLRAAINVGGPNAPDDHRRRTERASARIRRWCRSSRTTST